MLANAHQNVPAAAAQAAAPELRFDRVTPEMLTAVADFQLAAARDRIEQLLAVSGRRTIENTLQPYDDVFLHPNAVFNFLSIVHPSPAIRAAAAREFARLRAFRIALSQNRAVYEALAAMDLSGADAETRFYVARVLQNFRAAAIDRDEAARQTIARLRADMLTLEQQFQANLGQPGGDLVFASAAELEGLDPEWMASQRRGPAGEILVAQEFDLITRFARDPRTRERALVQRYNLAPGNHDTVTRLLKTRYELARASGFRTWAEFQLNDHMARTPARVTDFLDSVDAMLAPVMRREHAGALALLRSEMPEAARLRLSDFQYAARIFREDRFKVDPNRLREYFPYERVRAGVFDTVREVFGLQFRQAVDAPVWDPSVEAYDAIDDGRVLGRLYLDVSTRQTRTGGNAATHPFRSGRKGTVGKEVAITGRFKSTRAGDPSLMAANNVRLFFHEMGHAVHHLVATRRWFGTSGVPEERDFVEVPSSLFEAWAFEPRVLNRMARHYKTGVPLPPDLLEMTQHLDDTQNVFRLPIAHWQARFSLALHNQPTGDVDVDAIARDTMAKYLPYEAPRDRIHPEATLTLLGGYGAAGYTYPWSNVISADLLTRFNGNVFDPAVGARYRRTVLEGASSAPAARLVEDFLGRPFSPAAWGARVSSADSGSAR